MLERPTSPIVREEHGAAPAGPGGPEPPEVTVIITAYRRRQFLSEAIDSVARQSLPPGKVEIVLVKDFADRETDLRLAALPFPARSITEDLPLGEALARAVGGARGRLLCFLDDDDRFLPAKLAEVLRRFEGASPPAFLRHSFAAIDAQGMPLPAFEGSRPQPPEVRTIDLHASARDLLPWIYRYGAHINLSSMAVRADLARPVIPWLRRLTGGSDFFWFFVALSAPVPLRIDPGRWTEYRVHPSSSHASIDRGGGDRELEEVRRNLATAELLTEMYPDRHPSELARRFLASYRLEAGVAAFLMDERSGRWFSEWFAFTRTMIWRRQRYLLVPWAYCLLKAVVPRTATSRYRDRRRRDMLRSSASRPLAPA